MKEILNNKSTRIMKSLKGTYKFGRHYNGWSIWQYTDDEGMCASHVFGEEFALAKSAMKRVYELNGWGEPKHYPEWVLKEEAQKKRMWAWRRAA